jgi:outer membrane lipoprotein-sorting protein
MMNELAAARKLLEDAKRSFTSLRATHRLWRDKEILKERGRQLADTSRASKGWVHPPFGQAGGDQPAAACQFDERRAGLWVRRPSQVRIEHEEYVLVVDGDRWWENGRSLGPVTGRDETIVKGMLELEHVAFMLDPSYFAAMNDLTFVGTDTVGGRAAMRLKSPESADSAGLHSPGIGWASFDPEFELWVDAERGLLLRTAERFHRRDSQVTELVDVEFDSQIADEVFMLVLPAGQEFRRYEDACPRHLSIAEAARSVAFTFFVPENVPLVAGSWDGDVLFEPVSAWLTLGYIDRNRVPQTRLQISEASGSLDAEDLAGYEPVEHEGQSVLVRSANSRDGEWHSLLLSREGTRISINSMLDRETSIAIAHSLRPVKAT